MDLCASDFEYFLIDTQQGLKEPVDGVMGLARNRKFYFKQESKNPAQSTTPSILTALNLADQIDSHSFSFLMTRDAEGSTIDFGTPKTEERIAAGTELEYIRILDDFYWSALCQGFAMGSIENSY